jgi:PAS domain S-box-containing protein
LANTGAAPFVCRLSLERLVKSKELIKVLLIEDDEDDYVLAKELFVEIQRPAGVPCPVRFQLDWVTSFERGLETISKNQHDVCLVDYRLGAHNGIELLHQAVARGCQAPIILLTGQGEREIDMQAMQAGAADYLVKGRLDAVLLERSIRYALERKRASAIAAAEQARLATFGAEVGLALTTRDSLQCILQRCARAMLSYLNGALAGVWIFNKEQRVFDLQASEDAATLKPKANNQTVSEDAPASRNSELHEQPNLVLDVEALQRGNAILLKQLIGDPRFPEQDWARRHKMVSCAAFPLLLEDRLVGLMTLFAHSPLTEATLEEMGSVAHGIALCIERKRSEEALGASEFKYRAVVENIKEVIFQVDQQGRFLFLNPAWTSITGFKVKDTLETPLANYIHPEDRERHWEVFQQTIHRKQSHFRDEARYLACDNTYRWVEVYAQPSFEGDAFGASGTIHDITDRRRAEAEIQKLAAFVRFNPNPVLELGADGSITYINPAAYSMAQGLKFEDPSAILPPNAAATARECLRTGQSRLCQEVAIEQRTLSWSFFPIVQSQVVHCYGTDITDRINLEAQLRHAQKLESIGQLAAGVAHDFNNILTIIQGHADLLVARSKAALGFQSSPRREESPESAGAQATDAGRAPALLGTQPVALEPLKQISAAAKRGSTLTRQLLTFSRRQVMQPRVLDLNNILSNMTQMINRLLGEDVLLESNYTPQLPAIEADAGMIEQVLLNLAVNSRDAMPKGGRLSISTSAVEIDHAYAESHPESRLGKFVCVTVADTGCGMSPETLARIFEPFFTTKEVGKGTGLGLATVYGIVKQHQGWIEVSSQQAPAPHAAGSPSEQPAPASEASTPAHGTTFKIFLPASPHTAPPSAHDSTLFLRASTLNGPPAGRAPATPPEKGHETILLVEDEPVLRELARIILQDYDYRVLEASNGIEALQVWDREQGKIDLLLTDMVMPEGLNGRELADKLRALNPNLKVIYTSGYSFDAIGNEAALAGARFLQKPYPPPQLAQTVRECLDMGVTNR